MNFEQLNNNAGEAVKVLKAISNDNRLIILCHLVEKELSVGEMNERLPLSQSALSQHLAVLRKVNLVATRKQAQTVYYTVQHDNVKKILNCLKEMQWT